MTDLPPNLPRVSESLARIEAQIRALGSHRDATMLQIYKDHWWGEVTSDVAAIMRTIPADTVSYKFDGLSLTRPLPFEVHEAAAARAMYQSVADLGLPIAGAFTDERFAFADWGMMVEAVQTAIYPGRFLRSYREPLEPEQLYLVQWRMVGSHPMDLDRRLMLGEHVYNGAPLRVVAVDRAAVDAMMG